MYGVQNKKIFSGRGLFVELPPQEKHNVIITHRVWVDHCKRVQLKK